MEMNNFRGESHVAQQSRRDKLRVQHQNSDYIEDHYTNNNLEQSSVHHGLNPDLIQLRNLKYGSISYDPNVFSSDHMLNYHASKNSQVLLPQNESLVSADKFSIANLSHPNSSDIKISGDPQNCSNWKSIVGSQQSCDWVNNYPNNSTSFTERNLSPSMVPSFYMKQPNSYGYQDVVHSSLVTNPSAATSIIHQNSQRHFGEMQQCSSSSSQFNYQNTLQEVVTTATVGSQGQELARYGGKDSSELLLLQSFGDHQSTNWVSRPVEAIQHWDGSNTQGLSLSLSSVQPTKTREGQFGKRNDLSDPSDSKAFMSDHLCSSSRPPSIGSKVFGNTRENITGTSNIPHRSAAGPLGPFTGYATILKNSKYLKPTLLLLDEFCGITGHQKQIETREVYSDKISEEVGVSAIDVTESSMVGAMGGESGVSSSTFYSSNEISAEVGGQSSSSECYRPDYHQKKAKLLYMQEEVCRRYKQYHQQMQMVVSSFESVAGLSAATPYISMALKTISRHFRCLKLAISDQLRHMGRALGEDLLSPTAGTSSTSTKGETSSSRLKFINDHGFQNQKSGGTNQLVFFEPQQPVWRPQRGLPERAVAILRAWLFDHFLHPYPTDTDKHMLASQTGLTRNQVSNWFINARVRVWKPMVEEIHTLETKSSVLEPSSQTGKDDGNPEPENASHQHDNQPTTSRLSGNESSRSRDVGLGSAPVWNQEKRSRVECHQIPGGMDESLMSFLPYQRGGVEIGGAVSLTLGLRQSAESAQQQQLQQQEHYRQHFGGHMIHDFVG